MFTGIIEELGAVKSLSESGSILKLQVLAPKVANGTQLGQSICCSGICLTVVGVNRDLISFEIMPETFKRTNLKLLKVGDQVNLERALKAEGRLDGHFVTGHIDGTGTITKFESQGADTEMKIEVSPQIMRYVALKGSVAVDGVSLTVSAEDTATFSVNLIPYTLKNTILGQKRQRDLVNVECDILAKYTERIRTQDKPSTSSNITSSFLRDHGFVS